MSSFLGAFAEVPLPPALLRHPQVIVGALDAHGAVRIPMEEQRAPAELLVAGSELDPADGGGGMRDEGHLHRLSLPARVEPQPPLGRRGRRHGFRKQPSQTARADFLISIDPPYVGHLIMKGCLDFS